ncbi:hypothetical protein FRC07_007790 [Ceratobasidium sp. 392]|nr:hypothetical protein FRC07_007790 [Ceratobasidium sp. 392]
MMISRVIVGALVAALSAVAQSASTTDEKPFALASPGKLEQCKNTTIVWQGGRSPFKISIKPECGAGQNATGKEYVVSTPGATSVELPITFPAGTPVVVSITDSSNMQATAPANTVVSGDADDSCAVQTACPDNIEAPDFPVALVSTSSAAIPTDHLITIDPSATLSSTEVPTTTATESAPTGSATSMVVLYSYVSPSSTNSNPSSPTSLSAQSNAATLRTPISPFVILGILALIGLSLV